MWWLTPIIRALSEDPSTLSGEDHLRPGLQDHPGQHSETWSLQKILKKN